MGHFRQISIAAALLVSTAPAAFSADLIDYPPPEVIPVAVGGWYLRGDIGMSNQQLHGGLENSLFSTVDNLEFLDSGSFSSAPTYRVGIGYQFNPWFRGDLTAQLRGKSTFSALDRYEVTDDGNPNTWDGSNQYSAAKKEWLFLANSYIDLGTWSGITPYVGGGIGASQNKIYSFRDINTPNNGVAYGATDTTWNFAWALHAGLGFEVTDRLTLDLGYSYVNLGDAQSGDITTYTGTNSVNNPMVFKEIVSHDLTFGLRYKFN